MINWGIIGLGNIANIFAEAVLNTNNAKIHAISSLDKNRLDLFKKKFNLNNKNCYSDYISLIDDKSIDIIYIALPNSLHFKWVLNCIKSNKNILVEKPATIKVEEIEQINKILDNKQIFFAEGFAYRFHPQISTLFDIIKGNEIGELLNVESYFGNNIIQKKNIFGFDKIKIDEKKRLFNKNLGGGSILDLGCYPASLSVMLAKLKSNLSDKKVLFKKKKVFTGKTNVDLDAYAEIEFENGFNAKIGSSFKKNLDKITTIIGSKKTIKLVNSWSNNKADIIVNNKIYNIPNRFKHILSYEIETISNMLENKNYTIKSPYMDRFETEFNIRILEKWRVN